MKPEPLKDKERKHELADSINQAKSDGYYQNYFTKPDIKSAVEWLKHEVFFNLKNPKRKPLVNVNDVTDLIDKAFEDIK